MSVPVRYSGTAAVVAAADIVSVVRKGNNITINNNNINTSSQGLLNSVGKEHRQLQVVFHHQHQHYQESQFKNCCPPQNYHHLGKGGDYCSHHIYPMKEHLTKLEGGGGGGYQQQQQRTPEEVVPHQLSVSSSMVKALETMDTLTVDTPIDSPMDEMPSKGETILADGIGSSEASNLQLGIEKENYAVEAEQAAQTEWQGITDGNGGRFGTPGAASLGYQNYQQPQIDEEHSSDASGNSDDQRQINEGEEEAEVVVVEEELGDQQMDQTASEPQTIDNGASGTVTEPVEANNANNQNSIIITNNLNGNIEQEIVAMPSDKLYNTLKEYNALQDKYHTVLLLPKESKREVTAGGRDGSAYVLRCLKIWYELPSDVLFSAMSLVDRFLDRMAVKPKHMACMSVASFHIAIRQLQLKSIPPEDLVTISQCGCTAGDLERMANVIANKLGVQMGHMPITSVNYLRIYYALFHHLAQEIGGEFYIFYQQRIKLEELENRLEILLCDVKTTVITPSTLAMVLICLHLDFHIKESYTRGSPELKHVFEYILFLQQYMGIPDRVFTCGFSIVSGILSHYNGQNKQPYKQRLVWKLSSRTLRVLRPINQFHSNLDTIEEGIPPNTIDEGCRSRTESISSEEEEDWPTSPIIPIFEQC